MKKNFIIALTCFLLWVISSLVAANYANSVMLKTPISSLNSFGSDLNLDKFWTVYDIIGEEYYSETIPEKKDLENGAIKWMVEALWDPHSEFMDPETTKKFDELLSGDFEGIGAVIEKHPLGVSVDRIIKGSPAKKYDIRSGDVIMEANGENLENLDLYDAVDKIKGPAGSSVVLKIMRAGEDKSFEITVIRDTIHIPSVELEMMEEGKIAYISLNMFGDTTSQEFNSIMQEVLSSQAQGIILDVRDNGGGYLQSAVEILSDFIPNGEVLVKTRHKDSFFDENYLSQNTGILFDKKIVVLMNGNSASASEISAAALSEYNKAILVGEKSYGKWSVQQPFDLDDGSLLKLTIAKWYSPKDRNIDGEGIEPDIEILFQEEDYENKYDRQLEEAKKILQLFQEKGTIGLTLEAYKKSQEQNTISSEEVSSSGVVQE